MITLLLWCLIGAAFLGIIMTAGMIRLASRRGGLFRVTWGHKFQAGYPALRNVRFRWDRRIAVTTEGQVPNWRDYDSTGDC
jgi:hypothetical protein